MNEVVIFCQYSFCHTCKGFWNY